MIICTINNPPLPYHYLDGPILPKGVGNPLQPERVPLPFPTEDQTCKFSINLSVDHYLAQYVQQLILFEQKLKLQHILPRHSLRLSMSFVSTGNSMHVLLAGDNGMLYVWGALSRVAAEGDSCLTLTCVGLIELPVEVSCRAGPNR